METPHQNYSKSGIDKFKFEIVGKLKQIFHGASLLGEKRVICNPYIINLFATQDKLILRSRSQEDARTDMIGQLGQNWQDGGQPSQSGKGCRNHHARRFILYKLILI